MTKPLRKTPPSAVAPQTGSISALPSPPLSLTLLSLYLFLLPLLGGHIQDPKLSDPPFPNLEIAALRLFLLLIAGIRVWEGRKPGGVPWRPEPAPPILLFAAWTIFSALTGASFLVSYSSIYFLATGILTYLLVADAVKRPYGRVLLLAGILAGAAIAGTWGLREYIRTIRDSGDPTWRIFSTFEGPNLLASYLLPCLLLGLSGILVGERPWLISVSVAALMSGIGLMLTGSRGAVFLALSLAFVVWIALIFRSGDLRDSSGSRRRGIRLGAILAVGLVFGAYFMKPAVKRVGESASAGDVNSVRFRILTWEGTLPLIRERPLLGWGPGLWETAYARVARAGYSKAAHNGYLQAAAETGLPGLALWLGVLIYGLGGVKRGMPGEAGRTAALFALILHNGVDYGWLVTATSGLTWALIGARPTERDAERSGSPSRLRGGSTWLSSPKVGAGFAIATALAVSLALPPAYADWLSIQAEGDLRGGDFVQAMRKYRLASAFDFAEPDWPRSVAEIERSIGDAKHAVEDYREACRRDPLRAAHLFRLGGALEAAGDAKSALDTYRAALTLDPNATPILMRLAQISESAGNRTDATTYYRRIAEVQESSVGRVKALAEMEDPNYASARLKLAQEERANHDGAAALKDAQAGKESAEAYIAGMETVWGKVYVAGGQPQSQIDQKIQEMKDLKAQLEEIERSVASAHSLR